MPAKRTPKIEALVVNAIRRLQDVQGSSSREISNYISQEYDVPAKDISRQIQLVLQRGLSYGILQQTNRGHYTCNRDYPGQIPVENAGDGVMEPCPEKRAKWRRYWRKIRERRRRARERYRIRQRKQKRGRSRSRSRRRRRKSRKRRGRSRRRRRTRRGSRRGGRGRTRRRARTSVGPDENENFPQMEAEQPDGDDSFENEDHRKSEEAPNLNE